MPKAGYYAVARGRSAGVYSTWSECEAEVKGVSGARYKKFNTLEQAQEFAGQSSGSTQSDYSTPSYGGYGGYGGHTPDTSYGYSSSRSSGYGGSSSAATTSAYSRSTPYSASSYARGVHSSSNTGPASAYAPASSHLSTSSHVEPQNDDRASSSSVTDVWCDGSALGNGRNGAKAGWGVYFGPPGSSELATKNESRRLEGPVQTNNRAELTAILRACELTPSEAPLRIHSDSQYCIKAVDEWQGKWRSNDWRLSSGQPVQNRDLIEKIEDAFQARPTRPELVYVPGHSGDVGNDAADKLAKAGATKPV